MTEYYKDLEKLFNKIIWVRTKKKVIKESPYFDTSFFHRIKIEADYNNISILKYLFILVYNFPLKKYEEHLGETWVNITGFPYPLTNECEVFDLCKTFYYPLEQTNETMMYISDEIIKMVNEKENEEISNIKNEYHNPLIAYRISKSLHENLRDIDYLFQSKNNHIQTSFECFLDKIDYIESKYHKSLDKYILNNNEAYIDWLINLDNAGLNISGWIDENNNNLLEFAENNFIF